MNAQTLSFGAGQRPLTPRKIAPLAAIVVAHLLLFYLAQTGLLSRAVHAALPQVVEISFVAPPQAPAPAPKTVPVLRHVASVTPPPLLATPQVEATITTPPPQAPRSVEAPVVAAVAPSVAPAPPRRNRHRLAACADQRTWLAGTGADRKIVRLRRARRGRPRRRAAHAVQAQAGRRQAGRRLRAGAHQFPAKPRLNQRRVASANACHLRYQL